jgi:hypothetical protein
MIVVNNTELNLSNPTTENELWVSKWITEKKDSRPVKIKRKMPFTGKSILLRPPLTFDLSATITNPNSGISEKWVLCKTPNISNSGFKTYPADFFSIKTEVELDFKGSGNAERLFFLMNVIGVHQMGLVIENKEEEAKLALNKNSYEYEVGYWIMSKLSADDIIRYAWRWNINDIDGKSDAELRVEMLDLIKSLELKKDSKKGFKAFLEEVKSGGYFNKSVKDGVVAFNKVNWNCIYKGTTDVICQIPPARWDVDKEEFVIQHLVNNEKERGEFLLAISGGIDDIAAKGDDYTQIRNAAKLRKYAKARFDYDIGLVTLEEGYKIIEGLLKKPEEVTQE